VSEVDEGMKSVR